MEQLKGLALGITAGASTPDWIIKEAIDKMDNFKNTSEENGEQTSFMEEYEKTLIRLHEGDIVKGRNIYVNDDEATVDIGYKADGIITREELSFEGGCNICKSCGWSKCS
jgi:4-hydroxy-3-methylbut-2-enyl diphosphate reductase